MDIPTVGGARGIFELFVPGAFFLLNLMGIAYYVPGLKTLMQEIVSLGKENPLPATVGVICFGYLFGVLLRLFQVDRVDALSAFSRRFTFWFWRPRSLVRKFRSIRRKEEPKEEAPLWTRDRFPYITLLGNVCERQLLPEEAQDFYRAVWEPRSQQGGRKPNKQFFNFCKTVVGLLDARAGVEAYAEESLGRFIAGMFYTLTIAAALILALWLRLGSLAQPFPLKWILLVYLPAILVILRFYRFIRIKETQTLFAASFANRAELAKLLTHCKAGSESDRSESSERPNLNIP
jgi:hypothetical protein